MTTHAPSTPNPSLRKFAVIGNPVAHSRSPFIHQAFAHQTGVSLLYDRLCAPLDNFAGTVKQFFTDGGVGLNVTVPFKEQAWQMAHDGLSERARVAGAVNTLWMQNGQLKGCNTDGIGLLNDLERQGQNLTGKRILLVGAGGAAKGVVLPLLEAGCARLHVVNRTVEKAIALQAAMTDATPASAAPLSAGGLDSAEGLWDIVINATSSSIDDKAPALQGVSFAPNALAYDMFYATRPTAFMRWAKDAGAAHVCDGLGMLVGQAAVSFQIWNGVLPDVAPVLAALRAQLHAAQ